MATDYTQELQAAMQQAGAAEAPPGAPATGAAGGGGRPPTCDCQTPEECYCQVRMGKGEIPQQAQGEGA